MKTITFGEIMGRMDMPGKIKFRQGLPGDIKVTFAGAEASVAASIAMLGGDAAFVTALPDNEISDAVIGNLRNVGVDTSFIKMSNKGRLGLYFVEAGANQRPSKVIYDRSYSSVSLEDGEGYDWDAIFSNATWFHISGITPALSRTAADAAILACRKAHEHGVTVSVDLNFRKKLWHWEEGTEPKELCRRVMKNIVPLVDVVIGNEEDADDVLGIKAGSTDVYAGKLEIDKYPEVARKIAEAYPNVSKVAFTLRESISATHNNWGAMLYDVRKDKAVFAPSSDGEYVPYEIHNIIDRIGGGDAFSAGLVFALQDEKLRNDDLEAVSFAVAASCLCHSIYGDFNYSTREEVLALAHGDATGRVKR